MKTTRAMKNYLPSSEEIRKHGSMDIRLCQALDKPTKHCWEPTVINSPHLQEFMVSRIFSTVLILLRPLMDEFTLMEVF